MKLYLSKKITIILVFVSVLCGDSCFSPIRAELPFSFDTPRVVGLGKTFTSVADDENSVLYNPAGLSQINDRKVTISSLLQDYTWTFEPPVNLSWNYFSFGTALSYVQKNIGIHINYKTIGNRVDSIQYTKNMETLETIEVKDLDQEVQVVGAFGIEVFSGFKFGINGKYNNFYTNELFKYMIDIKNSGAFDIGIIYNITNDISFGLSIQNVFSTTCKYLIRDDYGQIRAALELPQNVNMGISLRLMDGLFVSCDVHSLLEGKIKIRSSSFDYEVRRSYHLGIEVLPLDNLSVRTGGFIDDKPRKFSSIANNPFEYEKRFNLGLGMNYKISYFIIDFALSNDFRKIVNVNAPFKYLFSTSYVFK